MRVLFTSTRGEGHVRPLLPYADALRRLGHEVLFAAPQDCATIIGKAGFSQAAFDRITDDEFRAIWAPHKGVREEAMLKIAVPEMFAGATARASLPGLSAAADEWRPDLVVRESAEYAGLVTAMRLGIPHARVNVHNCEVEAIINDLAAEPVDLLRADAGLAPDHGRAIWGEPVFTAFPEGFDGDARHGPDNPPMRISVSGRGTSARGGWAPKADRPLVYVTFGTVAAGLGGKSFIFDAVLKAVAGLDIEVLMTVGPDFDIDSLDPLPDHVSVLPFVPQAEVFPHAAAMLNHGGSGTLLGGFAAAVPQVVAPLFADQPFNARRTAERGLGLSVADPTPDALSAALSEIFVRQDITQKTRALAQAMAVQPVPDDAVLRLVELV